MENKLVSHRVTSTDETQVGNFPSMICAQPSPSMICRQSTPSMICAQPSPSMICAQPSPSMICTQPSPSMICTQSAPSIINRDCVQAIEQIVYQDDCCLPAVTSCVRETVIATSQGTLLSFSLHYTHMNFSCRCKY